MGEGNFPREACLRVQCPFLSPRGLPQGPEPFFVMSSSSSSSSSLVPRPSLTNRVQTQGRGTDPQGSPTSLNTERKRLEGTVAPATICLPGTSEDNGEKTRKFQSKYVPSMQDNKAVFISRLSVFLSSWFVQTICRIHTFLHSWSPSFSSRTTQNWGVSEAGFLPLSTLSFFLSLSVFPSSPFRLSPPFSSIS